ncbi:MAG: HD-GYP domain-containing protein [Gammaproteobacteria bacterium]|nr:HD-GYP domain-containing protein [Gammaproteobacteria bacterium]
MSPQHLQPGMYIEQLDRPWLETPLPFQGFYVRSHAELQWIKESCAYVFIDSGKSDTSLCLDLPEYEPPPKSSFLTECAKEMHGRAGGSPRPMTSAVRSAAKVVSRPALTHTSGPLSRLRSMFSRTPAAVETVEQPKTDHQLVREQVGHANETYNRARKIMHGVIDNIRSGGGLDVGAVEKVVMPVIDCVLESTDAMACVIRMKEADQYTYNHSLATSIWAVVFGKSLGFDKKNLETLGTGGLLLDIGKTRIPHDLLLKKEPLTPEELAELRRHVEYGVEILRETKAIDPKAEQMVATHHERHDGSGYPLGLSDHAIPVFGRIAGIVDTYDAMTSLRPYASPQSTYNVMRHLVDRADILFQNEIVERFIQVVGIFPTASLAELNTGEVGIVVEQNPVRRLRPKVMVILDSGKTLRSSYPVIDLSEMPADTNHPDAVWIVRGLEPGAYGIDPREYYL